MDSERYMLISKDENLDVAGIATRIDLLMGAKVHIDCEKTHLLEVIARQIHYHQQCACSSGGISHEVRQWAHILHAFCFVEKDRDRSTEMKEQSLETALYNTLARLFPKEE